MAKGNLLLGMGRGKLGDVVLYRQNGQQMSRPRVRVVKNPRTSGQQIQRMIQATIAYGYAGLKTIVDHSFEGVQYGGKSMNYFMKRNMDALRAKVLSLSNGGDAFATFAIPNVRVLYPNEYIVSNGSLAPCPAPDKFKNTSNESTMSWAPGWSGIPSLLDFMQFFGADAGDQLTFLFFNNDANQNDEVAALEGEKAYATALAIRRIKFKESYTDEELNGNVDNAEFDMSVTSDDIQIGYSQITGTSTTYELDAEIPSFPGLRKVIAGCVIHSKKVNEAWLRSPQTVVIDPLFAVSLTKNGFSLPVAYNAWMSGTTPIGVSEYILNGKPNTDTWPNVDDDNP